MPPIYELLIFRSPTQIYVRIGCRVKISKNQVACNKQILPIEIQVAKVNAKRTSNIESLVLLAEKGMGRIKRERYLHLHELSLRLSYIKYVK